MKRFICLFLALASVLLCSQGALAEWNRGVETPPSSSQIPIGEVEVNVGTNGQRKTVRSQPDPKSITYAYVNPGERFPCYARSSGNNSPYEWYYIWLDRNHCWGWISAGVATLHLTTGSTRSTPVPTRQRSSTVTPTPAPRQNYRPDVSPRGTTYIGDVRILPGGTGQRKIVRQSADPNSRQAAVAYPDKRYPCYDETRGTTGKIWYYIWIEENDAWGWISSGYATLLQ